MTVTARRARKIRALRAKLDATRRELEAEIRAATAEEGSNRELAELSGWSREQVRRIVNGPPEK